MTDEHNDHPHVPYWRIFGYLCIFTVASVIADVMDLKAMYNIYVLSAVVLLISCFKASYVMRYFMHLKFEGGWKYVILLPTVVLALAIPFALASDIGIHYYDVEVPQQNTLLEKEIEQIAKEKAEAEHHHGDEPAEHGGGH